MGRRTDLALEAQELWAERGEAKTLPGVSAETGTSSGYEITTVRILDARGEKELCKPVGTYITMSLGPALRREPQALTRGAEALCAQLTALLGLAPEDSVLVIGLGNAAVTADAVGPATAAKILATRHLVDRESALFGGFRRVSVLEPGVLGTTGMESAEVIAAVVERLRPDRVVAIDALASRRLHRVCTTVQLTDTGIVPGSGVGGGRAAVSRETLGVPVVAVGVPTVVDAVTLAADLLEQTGAGAPDALSALRENMVVTPKDIDAQIRDLAQLLALGINRALQPGLSPEDLELLMG